jgi:hypothetical protein
MNARERMRTHANESAWRDRFDRNSKSVSSYFVRRGRAGELRDAEAGVVVKSPAGSQHE